MRVLPTLMVSLALAGGSPFASEPHVSSGHGDVARETRVATPGAKDSSHAKMGGEGKALPPKAKKAGFAKNAPEVHSPGPPASEAKHANEAHSSHEGKPPAKESSDAAPGHETPAGKPPAKKLAAKESGKPAEGHGHIPAEAATKKTGLKHDDPHSGKNQPKQDGHGQADHRGHDEHEDHAPESSTVKTHPARESGGKHAVPENHGSEPKEDGHGHSSESEETMPQKAPKPDSAFARAVDWNAGSAEILIYAIKRSGKLGESECRGKLVTERMFLHPNGLADRKPAGKQDTEILNAILSHSGEMDGSPFSSETVVKMHRREGLRLLRQDQSLQGWPGATHRSLDCLVTPPRMRVLSSGGEPARDTVLSRWPVYTEEMLFTYVRSLPQRAGYREEIWLQDWGEEGRLALRPRFASVSVHSKTMAVRETDTWHVTVDREDGRRSEFWVSTAGLHPVVVAILADRSTWTLQEISRAKYWAW